MGRSGHRSRWRLERGMVSVGFTALAVAVIVAYANPATAYELSVYHGTPLGFWIGFGVALAVSVFAAVLTRDGRLRFVALTLGGCSITAFAGLPIIRGYFLMASGDSLTHLGWIREMALGNLHPVELIYPGVHVWTVAVARLTGFRLERSTMLVVLAFVVVYLLFVALSMRALTPSGLGRSIGVLSAFLLLPINAIVTKLSVHSISQAVFYFALVFFLFTKFVAAEDTDGRFTNVGVLLALASAAVVLYHPQQAAVVLVLFGTVSIVQYIDRRRSAGGPLTEYRTMYAQTVFLVIVFVLWSAIHSDLTGQMSTIISTIVDFITGTDGDAGAVVEQRGSSLTAIGSGIDEIFLKLFLVSAVYSLLAGIVILGSAFVRSETVDTDTRAIRRYVSFGFMVLAPFAFLHFVGDMSKLYFRYHGSMMLIVTVLGALGLYYVTGYRRSSPGGSTAFLDRINPFTHDAWDMHPGGEVGDSRRGMVGVVIVVMLALSLATVFPSPFIYQGSLHVTEMQVEGYETAFAHQDQAAEMSGVAMPHWRYRHAILGTTGRAWGPTYTPRGTFDHNITGYLLNVSRTDGTHYQVVTTYDRLTETQVYRGLRFTETDFQPLQAAPHVNRVQTNGEVQLYYVINERPVDAPETSEGREDSGSVDEEHQYVESSRDPNQARSVGR